MALACLVKNKYAVTWSDAKPLTPATNCSGDIVAGQSHYVLEDEHNNLRTTFEVKTPASNAGTFTIAARGTTQQLRKSTKEVWRSHDVTASLAAQLPNIAFIDGGYNSSVALSADRSTLFTWGHNGYGQLGNGGSEPVQTPTAAVTKEQLDGSYINEVAIGGHHVLLLTENGTLYAWGRNDYGQLGDGTTTNRNVPVLVKTAGTALAGKTIVSIAAGHLHSVAVDSTGKVYGWGNNEYGGSVGDGTTTNRSVPVAVLTSGALAGKSIRSVTSGAHAYATLAIGTDGKLYGWGANNWGLLGDGTTTHRPSPIAIPTEGTPLAGRIVKQVVTATSTTYVLATDNTLMMTGINNQGQRANGTFDSGVKKLTQIPTAGTPLAGKTISSLTADGYHVNVVTSDGKVYGWGWNQVGQTGIGKTGPEICAIVNNDPNSYGCSTSIRPVASAGTPMDSRTIVSLAAGDAWTYAVASDGTAYAWGSNGTAGMLGVGSAERYFTKPQQMLFRPRLLNY